jgi:O-antigen/teichoic acid export membrane protein
MTLYKSNLFANFAGSGIAALLQLVFIPFYIKFLGMEAYGLIGFYIMLQSVLQVLDLGLGPTMNREMARYSVSQEKTGEARDFTRTLETVYWVLGISAGAVIAGAAPLIAAGWIHAGTLPLPMVVRALTLMGGLASLQLPLSFYQGGLMGLQRQVLLNGVKISMSAMGSGGAVLILWLVSPTITAFLAWQLAMAALQAAVLRWSLWNSLPAAGHKPRFSPNLLRNVWRFAAGMSGIAVSTIILTQLDKILLSKLLPLKTFGYYALATAVGNGLYILITPVFNATFPNLSALVASRDGEGIRNLYHRGTQIIAALVFPFAAFLAFFPEDALSIWTGSVETAHAAAPIVRFLVMGTAINGIMSLPYALQLAHGWTKLSLLITVALIVTMAPSIYAMSLHFGAVGAASIWLLLNLINLAVGLPLTHRRLLPGEALCWLFEDVAPPLAVSVAMMGFARGFLTTDPSRRFFNALELSGLLLVVVALTASATPVLRTWMAEQWKDFRNQNA